METESGDQNQYTGVAAPADQEGNSEPTELRDEDSSNLHLSDVLDVIDDSEIDCNVIWDFQKDQKEEDMYPSNIQHQPPPQRGTHILNDVPGTTRHRPVAYTEILEQPAPKALRFRYECEGRSAGSIPGIRSTADNKTFPSIRVVGHRGEAFVVVSCVTKDKPYKPHPHNLVGRDCKTGVCTVKMTEDNMTIVFNNLGIQCIRKKDIDEALKKREEIKVDPFKSGFSHRNQPASIDLNAIRLCFQVFVTSPNGLVPIPPVVSEPIFDKKAMSELVITKLSHCSAPVTGGKEVILLCEKVAKEDIAVRFYEEHNGQVVWEANGEFQHSNVHKQVAICFKTPPYRLLQLDHMTPVFLQLKRPSDGATSEPVKFDYLPVEAEQMPKKRKIVDRDQLLETIRQHHTPQDQQGYRQVNQHANNPGLFSSLKPDHIKQEPRDNSHWLPGTPSPQPAKSPSPVRGYTGDLFPNTVQQQQQQGLYSQLPGPSQSQSPPQYLPASLPFLQGPPNTQQPGNEAVLRNTWGRPMNDLSGMSNMNPLHGSNIPNILGGSQGSQMNQQQHQQLNNLGNDSQPMSLNIPDILDSNDLQFLMNNPPAQPRTENDPEREMTDSLTKLIINEIESYK